MITFPLLAALLQMLLRRRRRHASLHELDARALADIGVDPSEIESIEAESGGRSLLTRLRIARAGHGF
jgi:uncharacterized protein YjiS (DUF1127 family)